jgi:hypothetical protein
LGREIRRAAALGPEIAALRLVAMLDEAEAIGSARIIPVQPQLPGIGGSGPRDRASEVSSLQSGVVLDIERKVSARWFRHQSEPGELWASLIARSLILAPRDAETSLRSALDFRWRAPTDVEADSREPWPFLSLDGVHGSASVRVAGLTGAPWEIEVSATDALQADAALTLIASALAVPAEPLPSDDVAAMVRGRLQQARRVAG